MQNVRIKTVLTDLDKAIMYFYSKNYTLAAKFAIAADYSSTELVNCQFGYGAGIDSASNTASMIAMTIHGLSNVHLMDQHEKERVYNGIKNQWLEEYRFIRDRMVLAMKASQPVFTGEEYRRVASESIANTICNIIIGRLQLPYEVTSINKYCDDARLSNPYNNSINWLGKA